MAEPFNMTVTVYIYVIYAISAENWEEDEYEAFHFQENYQDAIQPLAGGLVDVVNGQRRNVLFEI